MSSAGITVLPGARWARRADTMSAGGGERCLLARVFALACLLLILALLSGCGSGEPTDFDPTSEPAPPADADAIRDVNLLQAAAVVNAVRQIGGGDPDVAAVKYADITKDGREEALLPIASGGTLGNLGYVVVTMKSGAPSALLTLTRERNSIGGVSASLEDGKLVKYVGRYGPEDPRCCPSVLVKTTYYWDGSAFQVEKEEEMRASAPKQ